jgi:hypothetical protein
MEEKMEEEKVFGRECQNFLVAKTIQSFWETAKTIC